MSKIKARLSFYTLLFFSLFFAFKSNIKFYSLQFLTNDYQYLKLFVFFAIASFVIYSALTKLVNHKNNIVIGVFAFIFLFIGHLTSYIYLGFILLLLLSIFYIGHIFGSKLNYKPIAIFASGYGLSANLLHVPYIFKSIPLFQYYLLITCLFITFLIFNYKSFFKYIQKLWVSFSSRSPNFLYIFYFHIIALSCVITSFIWDDINAYLNFPLRAIISNTSSLSGSKASSLIFQNFHCLSFVSYIGSLLNINDYKIVYAYKIFNSLCYTLTFYFLIDFFRTFIKNKSVENFLFFSLCASSIWFVEITSNYTDFSVLLISLFCLSFFSSKKQINLNLSDYLIFSCFIAISLKSLVAILPLVFYDLFKNTKKGKILHILSLPIFALPIFVRNFIYTGNPTFPAMNNFWQSPYFSADPASILVSKFQPDWPKDISLFFNFLSNAKKPLSLFYTSFSTFYSPYFYSLSALILLFFLFRFQAIKSNLFIGFGFIAFYLTIMLPGGQFKYFIPAYIYLLLGFSIVFSEILDSSRFGFREDIKKFEKVFIFFLILIFPLSPYSGVPLHIKDNKIYSSNYINWKDKIDFYDSFNNYYDNAGQSDKKILLYYLQDKLFIKNNNVYELDWYDYHATQPLSFIVNSTISDRQKETLSYNFLCKNNYGYLILNRNLISPEFISSLDLIVQSEGQKAYKLNCR